MHRFIVTEKFVDPQSYQQDDSLRFTHASICHFSDLRYGDHGCCLVRSHGLRIKWYNSSGSHFAFFNVGRSDNRALDPRHCYTIANTRSLGKHHRHANILFSDCRTRRKPSGFLVLGTWLRHLQQRSPLGRGGQQKVQRQSSHCWRGLEWHRRFIPQLH